MSFYFLLLILGGLSFSGNTTTNSTECQCNGLTFEGIGGSACSSTDNEGEQFCYVDFDSGCKDAFESTNISDAKLSYQACKNQCTCAGVTSSSGRGGSDCGSIFAERQWCYVDKDSTCPDAEESSKMENHKWSFAACENQCTCAGVVNAGGRGDSDCSSIWAGNAWCYIEANSTCGDKLESSSMGPEYMWSFAACGGFEETTRPPVLPVELHNSSNVAMLGSLSFPFLMGNAHVSGVEAPYDPTCVEDCCFDCDTWESKINDVWGWTSEDGRQIAVAGTPDRTVLVDVTDGSDMQHLGFIPQLTPEVTVWKDIKIWESTAFICSESKGFGIQVLDLQQVVDADDTPRVFLPDEVFYNDSAFHCHNLVMNDDAPILYTAGTNICPSLARLAFTITADGKVELETEVQDAPCVEGVTYVHDAQCMIYNGPDERFHGEEICFLSTGRDATLAVYSWTTNTLIANVNYTNSAFSHQSWLSEDGKFMFHGDELDEHNTKTQVFDVRNLTDIKELPPYIAPEHFIDHNQYVVGRLIYQANYAGGLSILAYDDNGNLTRVGYYDYSLIEQVSFLGAWSVYPYFSTSEHPAGKKVVLTGYEGMQVFEINEELECYLDDSCDATPAPTSEPTVSPTNSVPSVSPSVATLDAPGSVASDDEGRIQLSKLLFYVTIAASAVAGCVLMGCFQMSLICLNKSTENQKDDEEAPEVPVPQADSPSLGGAELFEEVAKRTPSTAVTPMMVPIQNC